MATSN